MAFINLLQIIYPVGSFYFSTNKISPAALLGGTWESIKDTDPLLATITDSNVGRYIGDRFLPAECLPKHWHPIRNERSRYPEDPLQKRFVGLYPQHKITNADFGGEGWLLASDDTRGFDQIETSIKEAMYASTDINGDRKWEQRYLQPEGYGCYIWHRTA